MERGERIQQGLAQILIRQQIITPEDLQELHKAFAASEVVRFEEFLLDEDVVTKEQLLNALQEYYQTPAVDVTGVLFQHELVTMLPKELMVRDGIIPYIRDVDTLQVIAARPTDENLLPALGEHVSYDIVLLVGIYRDICDAAKEFFDEAVTVVHEDENIEEDADRTIDRVDLEE